MGVRVELNQDSRLVAGTQVLSRRAGEETVLLNLDSEEYFGLEQVGARLWELLEDGASFGAVVSTLLGEYDVPRPQLEEDLRLIISDMVDNGLIVVDET